MKNAAEICAIIVFASLAGFRADAAQAPTAAELLDNYTGALDSLRSTIVKAEITSTHAGAFARDFRDPDVRGLADRGTSYRRTELRTDGKRVHSRDYIWGHVSSAFPSIPEARAHYNCHNWDGEQLYSHGIVVSNPKSHGIAHLYKPPKNEDKGELSRKFPASYLMGYNLESDERMDSILRRARNVSVRPKTERIGGSDCYVIDANTDSGRIFLWIDPAHGYHPAKAETTLGPGDLVSGRNRLPGGDRRTTRLENVRFKKVDDIWVPIEADAYMDRHFGGRNHTTQTWHYKRTEVVVNPDHEALGSFDNALGNPKNDPELKNGADVHIHHIPGDQPQYIWQDGKVVDKDGTVIMDCTPEPKNGSELAQSEMLGKKPGDVRSLLRKRAAGQAGSERAASESGPPTARELLDKYTDALNAVRSFATREDSVKKLDYAFDRGFSDRSMAGVKGRGQRQYSRGQKRTDGKHFHWRQYSWGNLGPTHGDVDETQAHYNCNNWDGVTLYGHAGNVKVSGIVTLSKPTASQVEHPMSRTPPVSYLVGYNMESDERMDSILRKAKNISVSSRMENVGGSDCYVIRAKTDKGTISLWIDPAHGYNLAKAEAMLSEGDFAFDYRLKRGESRVTKLENVRFERVNGVWVPMEADVSQHRNYSGGTVNEDYHYKRTEFVLNPDHDALGSFDNPMENPKNDPELKNGTEVCRLGDPDTYIWQDGKVVDKDGKVIMGGTAGKKTDSAESQP